jgi:ribosomal biogenesis protein LAS1
LEEDSTNSQYQLTEAPRASFPKTRAIQTLTCPRFITGLSDTQVELTRDRPSWFLPNQTIQFPLHLQETRHRIVHRHLPSLAELKRAAKESLDWLWEWYWSQLDAAFATPYGSEGGEATLTYREIRERLQGVLKSYVKERKTEIKSRGKGVQAKAAESAVASHVFLSVPQSTKQNVLLELLVDEKAVLPTDKKMGTSMSGAFLVWSPFLLALCKAVPDSLLSLLNRIVGRLDCSVESDPRKEGLYDWCIHILTSTEWKEIRQQKATTSNSRNTETRLSDYVLGLCFTSPTLWTLKLAENLIQDKHLPAREPWLAVLKAAQSEETETEMEAVVRTELPANAVENSNKAEKKETVTRLRGPQKRIGLWRPLSIGVSMGAD